MTGAAPSDAPRDRLPAVSDRGLTWLRPLWLLAFAFAVLADVAGAAYVLHDTYENDPVFAAFGLSNRVEFDGSVLLGPPLGRESAAQGITDGSRIVAVNGQAVSPDISIEPLTNRLRAVTG